MEIENGRVLCVVAWRRPDYLELYRVDGMLALRDLSPDQARQMTGHPGNDLLLLPTGENYAFAFNVRPATLDRIERWVELGHFIATYITVYRNRAGYPRASEPNVTWRKPANYLTEADIAWLKAYAESSYWYTEQILRQAQDDARRLMTAISEIAAAMSAGRDKPKAKARVKQRRERAERLSEGDDYPGRPGRVGFDRLSRPVQSGRDNRP